VTDSNAAGANGKGRARTGDHNRWIEPIRRARVASLRFVRRSIGRLGAVAPGIRLPGELLRLSIEPSLSDPRFRVIRASVCGQWVEQAARSDRRLQPNSLTIDHWEIDFGDGTPPNVSTNVNGLTVSHRYEPGFFVVKVTAAGSGQGRVLASIPSVGIVGEGLEFITFTCSAVRTVLVSHSVLADTSPRSPR
jgi:hypothetical protein